MEHDGALPDTNALASSSHEGLFGTGSSTTSGSGSGDGTCFKPEIKKMLILRKFEVLLWYLSNVYVR